MDTTGTGTIPAVGGEGTGTAGGEGELEHGTGGEGGEGGAGEGGEGGEGTEGGEGAEGGEGEGGEGTEGEPTEDDLLADFESDGRKVDAKTRTAIAKLANVDKVSAKIVRDAYFSNQALLKAAGDAKDSRQAIANIRAANATIESLGGEEGITNLQEEVSDYRTEIKQFTDGDPQLIETLIQADPEALGNIVQVALDKFAARGIEEFDKTILPAFTMRLEKAGLPNTIQSMKALHAAGKTEELGRLLDEMESWWKNLDAARKNHSQKIKDRESPEILEARREREAAAKDREDMYSEKIETNLNRLCNGSMRKVVEPFFKDLKLTPEGRRRFVGQLQSEVWAAMKADKTFQRQIKAVRAKGDAAQTAEFAHQKFSEFLPMKFRQLRNELYPNYKVKKPTSAAGTNGAGAGTGGAAAGKGAGAGAGSGVKVSSVVGQKPKREDVDWKKTTDEMWIKGHAILKNGKEHKFDWRTVS